jgi:glycosyltransferase involved in cell wall biosynthesis
LNVWRQLVRQNGPKSPKLVLVGSRWRTSDAVADMLERCDIVKNHIVEIAGLPSPGLRLLLAGARALLMPSFAEGFGIPIVEALALGTPVIASDLPAHREAGGGWVTYVSPIDGLGWLSAIRAHAHSNMADFSAKPVSAPPHRWRCTDYFSRIETFVIQ